MNFLIIDSTLPYRTRVTYIEPSGEAVTVISTKPDDSLMTLAVSNRVDMEGACDGELACSTCHCVFPPEEYARLLKEKPPTDEELDMLDTAYGLTATSRLGCQIPVKMLTEDITVIIPAFTR